ncbi:MAG TPA: zinc-dependent metalloprotease [Candidatus Dormibacteraeota bacterium]|jgi:coenzyme F420 biosynthesis associated uncharacterized protein|nr:zinc-dependent metalloprotease [Candidatus Dormibacteraeota bacterium]
MATSQRQRTGRASAPRVLGAATLVLGALAVRELARPRPREKARLVDWELVRERALRGTGEPAATPLAYTAGELGRRYDEMAAGLRPWIAEALGEELTPDRFPAFRVVDRRGWVEVNIELFRALMEPVLELQEMVPASALTDLGRRGVSEYLGMMLGFLSKRVLGQYDPVLLAPALAPPSGDLAPGAPADPDRWGGSPDSRGGSSLYLVEPNIERWEARAAVGGEPLRQWLVLHEVTHAWEFEAHPWLRDHLNGLIGELIARRVFAAEKPDPLRAIVAVTVGARSQWRAMARIQAVMALLEGFSNVVMRRVGEARLPRYAEIDAEFNQRSGRRGPAERLFFKLTGLEMKMQQYVQGEAFCDAVIAAGGMDLLRRVWAGPESLPALDEIRRPARWISRITGVTAA